MGGSSAVIRIWLQSLGLSLLLTLGIELAFALLMKKRGCALAVTALVNVVTNPPVVLSVLLWQFYGLPALPAVIALLEALAILAEGAVYRRCEAFSHPWLFSLGANLLSFGLGAVLNLVLR